MQRPNKPYDNPYIQNFIKAGCYKNLRPAFISEEIGIHWLAGEKARQKYSLSHATNFREYRLQSHDAPGAPVNDNVCVNGYAQNYLAAGALPRIDSIA